MHHASKAFAFLPFAAVLIVLSICSAPASSAQFRNVNDTSGRNLPIIDSEVLRKSRFGPVPVLVELRIVGGFRPEGNHSSPDAVREQRMAIASAQDRLLENLRGTKFRLGRRFSSVPLLSLEIQPDSLAKLETLGVLIIQIREDVPVGLSGAGISGRTR